MIHYNHEVGEQIRIKDAEQLRSIKFGDPMPDNMIKYVAGKVFTISGRCKTSVGILYDVKETAYHFEDAAIEEVIKFNRG
jgi:hypothetical protein